MKIVLVKYECRYCGMNTTRNEKFGKPAPGFCKNKPKLSNGLMQPHTWVIKSKTTVDN